MFNQILRMLSLIKRKEYKLFFADLTFEHRRFMFKQRKIQKKLIRFAGTLKQQFQNPISIRCKNVALGNMISSCLCNLSFVVTLEQENYEIAITDRIEEITDNSIFIVDNESSLVLASKRKPLFVWVTNEFLLKKANKLFHVHKIFHINTLDQKHCTFYLSRFLLSYDLITFELFCNSNLDYNPFANSNYLCLTLPEYSQRYEYADNLIHDSAIKTFNFNLFTGLRHYIGWVGCGYSYKFLFKKAIQYGMNYIIICEDDIILAENFKIKLREIRQYALQNKSKWDVISGFITRIDDDTKMAAKLQLNHIELCTTNKLYSTLFSFYNNTIFQQMVEWEPNRKTQLQIDAYINHINVNILFSYPFIVTQNQNLDSAVWSHSNKLLYDKSINRTNNKLQNL